MKFKKFVEAPWVDTPDHGTFDMGLELLNKDKKSLIQRVRNIFLGKEEFGAHGSRIKLDTMEDKEKFKQELINDVIFLSYCRKVFGVHEQQIIKVIDNAIQKSELVRTEETTRNNKHDRRGVVGILRRHEPKPNQNIKAINRMSRPYGENLEAWEDIKEDTKIFGVTIESVEEKIKEILKRVSNEAMERKLEAIGHSYPEEAEAATKRSMKSRDLVGALVNKGSEKSLDFDIDIETGIKKSIVMLSRQIDMLLNEHQSIDQIIDYLSDSDLKVVKKFIRNSFSKGELEWVVFFQAIKELMKETQKVTPGAYSY